MCPGSVTETETPARRSLHDAAIDEALRHKWIESERAGRDLGDGAIRSWARQHWHTFVRQCWIEHLEGRVFWIELDERDFGLLRTKWNDSALLDEIVARLSMGAENLDILCWSVEHVPVGEESWNVVGILERLDINAHRLEFPLEPYLLQAG